MFALLSGEFVHRAESAGAQLVAAATKRARSVAETGVGAELPAGVVEVVDKALAFEPGERWKTAREMRAALSEAVEGALGEGAEGIANRVRGEIASGLTAGPEEVEAEETQKPERGATPQADTSADPPATTRLESAISTLGESGPSARPIADKLLTSSNARRRPLRIVLASVVALAIGVAVLVRARGTHVLDTQEAGQREPPHLDANVLALTGAPSRNPEAMAHFNDGIQSWRDAAGIDATTSFSLATDLDPEFAAAHLYLTILSEWTNDASRAHHRAASMHRERLGLRDRALLDAYEPTMAVEPDLETTLNRLTAIREKFPSDWIVLYSLSHTQFNRGDLVAMQEVVDDFLRHEPSLAIAWQFKGLALTFLDDMKNGRDAFNECIRLSPYGDYCIQMLARFDLREGQCAVAESELRELTAKSPSPRMLTLLAEALQAPWQLT